MDIHFQAAIDNQFHSDLLGNLDNLDQFLADYSIEIESQDETEFKNQIAATHSVSGAKVVEVCNAIFARKKWVLLQTLGIPDSAKPTVKGAGAPLPSPWGS